MIEESLLKSNFIGRDGFRWWIGQIPPIESHGKQLNGEGWGNRIKVRIMGYHPFGETELSNNDLPWAQILLSTTDGSGASNYGTNPKIRPGDIVFGFFLDGDNAQIPVIMGCFGRTSQVPMSEYDDPFIPFTGYTTRIKNDGSKLKRNERNEQNSEAQKSPYYLPPSVANQINQISYYSGVGDSVYLGTNQPKSKLGKIETELQNAIKFLENIKSYPNIAQQWIDGQVDNLCEEVSKKIHGIASDIVNGIINETYEKMIPALNQGSDALYDSVNSSVFAATQSVSTAHLAAVKAQEETVQSVKEFQKLIPCLIASIIQSLASLIKDMVCAILENVANAVKCVVDQFIGGLLNGIIDLIISGLSSILGILSVLLSFSGFNLPNEIRSSASGLSGVPFSLNCGEEPENPEDSIPKWKVGSGPENTSSFDLNQILNIANTASSVASGSGVPSELQSIVGSLDFFNPDISITGSQNLLNQCYAGPPLTTLPPTITIFGGGGSGAEAIPVFTPIDTAEDGEVITGTSSIIGAIVTSGGSGYTYPPFVVIEDNSNRGYGAVARSVIENGEVVAIIVEFGGERYVSGETLDFTISRIIVENPGINYQDADIVTDNLGNEYELIIDNGSILKVTPINIIRLDDLPVISIISDTGSGARLKPVFGFREDIPRIIGETDLVGDNEQVTDDGRIIGVGQDVKRVIDCIS